MACGVVLIMCMHNALHFTTPPKSKERVAFGILDAEAAFMRPCRWHSTRFTVDKEDFPAFVKTVARTRSGQSLRDWLVEQKLLRDTIIVAVPGRKSRSLTSNSINYHAEIAAPCETHQPARRDTLWRLRLTILHNLFDPTVSMSEFWSRIA